MDGPTAQEKGPVRTPVEEASREDLVKHVKRQLALLQKQKAKCDELSEKCRAKDEEIETLRKKCNSFECVQREHDELQEAYLSLQGSQEKQFHSFRALEEQLAAANDDAVKWRRRYQDCVEKLECTESKLTALVQGTECLREEVKRFEHENKDLQHQIEELKNGEAEARSIIASLQQQEKQSQEADVSSAHLEEKIEELLAQCEALKQERDSANASRDVLNSELENVAKEKKEYTEQFFKLLEERSLLENQRDMKVNECNLLQEEKHGLERQVSELYTSKEDLEKKEKEFAKILDENSSLEKSLTEAMAENTQLQHEINDLQEKFAEMNAVQEELRNDVAEASSRDEVEKLKHELTDIEDRSSLQAEELQKLDSDLKVVLHQKEEAEHLAENLRAELESNRQASRDENSQKDAFQKLEELSLEIEELRKQLAAVTAEKEGTLMSLCNYQKAEVEWKTQKDKLEKEILGFKKEYDTLVENVKQSASRISALEKQLQDSLQEKHNVVEELAQVRDLQQFLEDEAKELHRECDKVKTEAKRLEADLENDHLHIQKLEHELEEAEEREHTSAKDLDALRCLLEDIVACITELHEELFTCKVNCTEPNFKSLGKKFKKIFCLVVTAVENGLADFNVEEFSHPGATLPQCCVVDADSMAVHNEEVEMLKREVEELQDQLLSSRTSAEQLQLEKIAVEDELAEEKHRKDKANAEIVAKTEAIASLEKTLASVTSENEGKVCALERQLQELTMALSAKEDVLRRTLDDVDHFSILSSGLEVDNRHLNNAISKLKEELALKAEKHLEDDNNVFKLHENLVKLISAKAQLLKTHNILKEELRTELDEFYTVFAVSRGHVESVLEKAAELEKQCYSLKSENCCLLDENSHFKLELADKEKAHIRADDNITQLRTQVAELIALKQEADDRLNNMLATLSSQESILHSTSEKLTQVESLNHSLQVKNKDLAEKVSQLMSELAAKEEEHSKTNNVSSELHVQLDSIQREKVELLEERAVLTQRLCEAKQEFRQLQDEYNHKSALEQSLTVEVSELTSKVSALSAENLTKTSLVEEIHGRLDDLLERCEILQEELNIKMCELNECKQSFIAEQNKITNLQNELAQVKTQLSDVLTEQERLWKVFFPEQDCDTQRSLSELSNVVSSISVWGEVNECLLRYVISLADATASDSNGESALSADIKSKVKEYSAKVEHFSEDKADVITLRKVEEVKLGIKVLEAIHLIIASPKKSDQSVTVECDIKDNERMAGLTAAVKEKDEKLNKFKSLVVKLKRELAEKNKQVASHEKEQNCVKSELDKQMQASKQALQNFQSLQKEYDKLQDDNEATKSLCKELETKLTSVVNELATSKLETSAAQAERDKLKQAQEVASAEIKAWEQCKAELEAKLLLAESETSTTRELNDHLRGQLAPLEDKIVELAQQLQAHKEQHDSTVQQLEKVQKESKMQSLLHLEMADYERSVAELNAILKEKSRELECMKEESLAHQIKISGLTEHIHHLEEQRKCDESKISALKETVAGLKEGLATSRRHEEQLVKAEVRLESDLKAAQLREDEAKLNYADLLRKFQNMESSLRTTRENAQRNSKALESKVLLLKEELAATRNELNNTRTEFENYKTRVHTVLKQQKKSTEGSSNTDTEANGKLQFLVEQLRARVQELMEQLETQRLEAELTQEEYEHLAARHQQVVSELETREKDWKTRLEEAIKKNTHEMSIELDKQLKQQHDKLTSTFQKKLAEQEEEQRVALESQRALVQELRLELKQEQQTKVSPQEDTFDISLQERQEGEGSECATSSTSIPITTFPWEVVPSAGFAPLEQLLHENSEQEENPEVLSARISEAHKKLNHMSELLNDSESSNLRMTEQIRVLKEEIRRLERNKEREKHAENLEYLKNIILKFTTLKGGSEKERLIPVLSTMLKLSPEEQKQLQSVVAGSGEVDSAAAGWGGYLPRWPGIV